MPDSMGISGNYIIATVKSRASQGAAFIFYTKSWRRFVQLACCVACAEEVHYKYNKERKGFKMNTERLDIRISPDLKAQLQAAADADGRSVSNYIEMLIKRELKKGKYGKEE